MAIRTYRKKTPPETKRAQNFKTRYGITPEQHAEMLSRQNGLCGICGTEMPKPVVDHCHVTGRVRGMLCHSCNIKLPTVEDMGWVMLAWAYLEGE